MGLVVRRAGRRRAPLGAREPRRRCARSPASRAPACASRAGCSPRAAPRRARPRSCSPASTSYAATTRRRASWPPSRSSVPVVDMPRHLDYLLARFEAAGGELELRRLDALSDVAGAAPVVVNCSGVGARAPRARPDRARRARPARRRREPGPRGVLHGGAGAALGGLVPARQTTWCSAAAPTRTTGASSRTPRWPRRSCAAVRRSSRGWPAPGSSSTASACARRAPSPRGGGALGPSRCVHDYGHGGTGVALAWGCARDVASIVARA